MEYTREELEKLHDLSLQMAQYFVNFCKQHNLTCYLCGGGCIGTIRHKGFIPWDDDLDFFMPREDYEKLILLWNNEEHPRYKISNSSKTYNDRNLFFTIRDIQTTLIKPYQKDLDIPHGIVLDVLPIDGYPKSGFARKMQMIYALIYSLYRSQTVPTNHGKMMAFGSKIALGIIPKGLHYPIWRFCEKQMTKYPLSKSEYMTELCSGPGYMKNRYPRRAFDKAIFMPFENTEMPIPEGYDAYLKIAFGDYMQLPPVEKQKAHHDVELLDLENGYEKYIKKN